MATSAVRCAMLLVELLLASANCRRTACSASMSLAEYVMRDAMQGAWRRRA